MLQLTDVFVDPSTLALTTLDPPTVKVMLGWGKMVTLIRALEAGSKPTRPTEDLPDEPDSMLYKNWKRRVRDDPTNSLGRGSNGLEAEIPSQAARSSDESPDRDTSFISVTRPFLRIENSIDTFPS